uniref:SurA N-terminal domain-containing protein n=1 Tax=uncultured Desulfovibrio sp. TaxID=167968 RepID=UPI00265D3727
MKKSALLILMAWLCLACTAQAAQLNKIAAVVNGQVITMFDLQKAALPELGRARLNPNDPKQADKVNVVFRKVLDSMIMDILLEQEAKRLSITASDSEIDQELTKMMKMRRLNRAQFEAELKKQGMSVDELRKTLKTNMLRQRVMGAEVGRRVVVTDDEIRAYYEMH